MDRDIDIIFTSPEALLESHRDIVMKFAVKKTIKVVFVDEAHCNKKYGKPNKKKTAYRPCYGQLGEIRSIFGPNVPVVALTATASPETKSIITASLCLTNSVEIIRTPDKQNITYWVQEIKTGDISMHFDWLVKVLTEYNIKTPRMILFFRQLKHTSEVYEHLISRLGKNAYVNFKENGPNDDRNRLFDMFHLKTDEEIKDSICSSYQIQNGNIRVVLSSTSFSMGLDVKGVDYVIHYGPANDIDDYVQETGRAGRDPSKQCHAVLIKYKRCLSSQNITSDMKSYVKSSTCRRKNILTYFNFGTNEIEKKHNCCDNCRGQCRCDCLCEMVCTCESTNLCTAELPLIVAEIVSSNQKCEGSDSSDCSEDQSDSDIEVQRRRPQIVYSSTDSD